MKNIFAKLLFGVMIGSGVLLAILLHVTTPAQAGAIGILAVFILAYVVIVSLLTFFMYAVSRIIVATSKVITLRKPLEQLSFKRAYYFSSVIGLAPVIIVSMQSVGTFGVYEFGLVTVLVIIGCIYVTKRTT